MDLKRLDQILCSAQCLYGNMKARHWNVSGSHFIELHKTFDKIANTVLEMGDKCAERLVQYNEIPSHTFAQFLEGSIIDQDPVIKDWELMVSETEKELDAMYRFIDECLQMKVFDEITNSMLTDYTGKTEFYRMEMNRMIY